MNWIWFGIVTAVGLVAVVTRLLNSRVVVRDRNQLFGMPRLLKPVAVRLDELAALVEAMSNGSAGVRYAGLTFNTADRPSAEDAVNLNLPIENGKVGFDWVLLAPRNLQDQGKFESFARTCGIELSTHSLNGVSYLRVECEDVAKFTASIVTEMYNCSPTEPLQLVHEGFDWPRR